MTIIPRRLPLLASLSVLALAACGGGGAEGGTAGGQQASAMTPTDGQQPTDDLSASEAMAANDPAAGAQAQAGDDQPRPVMRLQVALDRMNFSPGVIDGKMGMSTELALRGFQEANGLKETGEFDEATRKALAPRLNVAATRVVTVPAAFVQGPFNPVPDNPAEQAEMDRLGYNDALEKLAERFHTTSDVLRQLNPALGGAAANEQPAGEQASTPGTREPASRPPAENLRLAGQQLRVPNIGNDRVGAMPNAPDADADWRRTLAVLGVQAQQPKATRIVGDKSGKWIRAYDAQDRLVAQFQATMGSSRDPLPLGDWKIYGVAKNPPFSYDPDLFWDVPDSEADRMLPPGPNGPVGVVWIDLSKEHYGIHGTSAPETIGRAESHGCVRLTNWDAARLAQMVDTSTKVVFQA